jgi:hypothetical protein
LAVAVSALVFATAASAASVSFAPAHTYAVADASQVAVGDVNGDGRPDVVVGSSFSDTVSVLLNSGDGSLAPGQVLTGLGALSVAIRDIDRDGRADLAVADGGGIAIMRGNGDGTFGQRVEIALDGRTPIDVEVADLDNDGHLDLVTANVLDDDVSIVMGEGGLTFAAPARYLPVGLDPDDLVLRDFNGDGRQDLAVINRFAAPNSSQGNVNVTLGNGDGTFASPPRAYVLPPTPIALDSGDVNGDGRLDLVTANTGDDSISVLLGQGGDNFAPPTTIAQPHQPTALALRDLDADGKLDVAVANTAPNVDVRLGTGDGGFGAIDSFAAPAPAPFRSNGVATGDLNGDGAGDLVTTGQNSVAVLLQTAPDTIIVSGPAEGSATASTTAAFTYRGDPAQQTVGFRCALDQAAFAPCPTAGKTESALSEGDHTFRVAAVSRTGNADPTPATRRFTVDRTPPDTRIDSGPSGFTTATTPTFAFSSTEAGSTFECRVDAAAFAGCTSPRTTDALSGGNHTFQVRAVDRAGNVDASAASRSILVCVGPGAAGAARLYPPRNAATAALILALCRG